MWARIPTSHRGRYPQPTASPLCSGQRDHRAQSPASAGCTKTPPWSPNSCKKTQRGAGLWKPPVPTQPRTGPGGEGAAGGDRQWGSLLEGGGGNSSLYRPPSRDVTVAAGVTGSAADLQQAQQPPSPPTPTPASSARLRAPRRGPPHPHPQPPASELDRQSPPGAGAALGAGGASSLVEATIKWLRAAAAGRATISAAGSADGAATGPVLPVPPVLLLLAAAILLLSGARRRAGTERGGSVRRSPPGPFAWPLVGNALHLGRLPHLAFGQMARRYGCVFQLRLGCRRVVVLNGEVAIRRALVGLGVRFAGCPDFPSFELVSGGRSVAFGSCSPCWRARRSLVHAALRTRSTVAEVERHVVAEARDLVQLFLQRSQGSAYFEPSPLLVVANTNVLCALCFGRRYVHADSEFTALLGRNDRFGQTVGAGSMVDVLSWLLRFPNPVRRVFRDFQALNWELHSFVCAKVAQHRQTFDPHTLRDVSDVMIAAVEHGDRPPKGLGPKDVEGAMMDIFGAGQDTISTALSWVLLLLLKHPQLQRDLQAQLDQVVGRSRLPTAEDRPHLPLLEAFIYETLRYSSFVPITIPHATTNDVEFQGFHIPKGTVVFINQWSVNHDCSKWPNPQCFDPMRFLDTQQRLDRNRAGSVMIFSAGQRRCIGDQLSKLQLFLFTAILLHQCSFHANPAELLTMDCIHGLALRPRPFTVTVQQRHPALIQP